MLSQKGGGLLDRVVLHAHLVHLVHLIIGARGGESLLHVEGLELPPESLPPLRDAERVHTDLLDELYLVLPLVLPVHHIVGRLSVLKSAQHGFIFVQDPIHLLVPDSLIK